MLEKLQAWLEQQLPEGIIAQQAITNDASNRQYFRLQLPKKSLIAVISPPETENNTAFINLSRALKAANLNVPEVYSHEPEHGFMLLSDLGDELFYPHVLDKNSFAYAEQAVAAMLKLQQAPIDFPLPKFGADHITLELERCYDWCFKQFLQLDEALEFRTSWLLWQHRLIQAFTEQQQAVVHRDFHLENLLLNNDAQPGIIDFQDAMYGPITYDLVSLLRDRYSLCSNEQLLPWMERFYAMYQQVYSELPDFGQFYQDFANVALQRHLKVLGIFARLYLRDNKPKYLQFMPQFVDYLLFFSDRPEWQSLHKFVAETLKPRLLAKLEQLK